MDEIQEVLDEIYAASEDLVKLLKPYEQSLLALGSKRLCDMSLTEKVKTAKLLIELMRSIK
jgi:hypothetical protein